MKMVIIKLRVRKVTGWVTNQRAPIFIIIKIIIRDWALFVMFICLKPPLYMVFQLRKHGVCHLSNVFIRVI